MGTVAAGRFDDQGDPLIETSPEFRFLSLFAARERKVRGVPDGEEVWS